MHKRIVKEKFKDEKEMENNESYLVFNGKHTGGCLVSRNPTLFKYISLDVLKMYLFFK